MAFGNVTVGQTKTAALTIQNTGNAALTVNSVSCPAGFSADWTSGTIAAGSSRNVTVTFSPTSTGSHSGNITVLSSASNGTQSIAASGTGVQATPPPEGFETVSSCLFTDGTITLERKRETSHTYTNSDGVKFFKTTLAIGVTRNGQTQLHTISTANEPYTATTMSHDNPCMLIDMDREIITVFSNSKPNNTSYSMSGYAYRKTKGGSWQTETTFTSANDGWYAFFGGSNNGNPTVYHFSYAGYYAKVLTRSSSGSWANSTVASIHPNLADRQYYSHKNILVTSSAGVDAWSFTDSPAYDSLTGFNNNTGSLSAGAAKVSEILE
jgi:hypothetical protein